MAKRVDPRTMETALRKRAKECGYGDYIPRKVIEDVVGLKKDAVRRRLKKYNVPRSGENTGTRYQLIRVAEAFSR